MEDCWFGKPRQFSDQVRMIFHLDNPKIFRHHKNTVRLPFLYYINLIQYIFECYQMIFNNYTASLNSLLKVGHDYLVAMETIYKAHNRLNKDI